MKRHLHHNKDVETSEAQAVNGIIVKLDLPRAAQTEWTKLFRRRKRRSLSTRGPWRAVACQ
jgi:hypothetical protein